MSFAYNTKNYRDKTSRLKLLTRENGFENEADILNDSHHKPPSYFELGKRSRDLFSAGYHFGFLCLNIITKSPNNVKFTTACVENLYQGSLFGSLEAKYEIPGSLVLTEKWNTDCTVTTEICCKNRLVRGFNLTFSGSLSPRSGDKLGKIKAEWANKIFSFYSQMELGSKFFLLTSSAVLKYRGFLGGVLGKFDAFTGKVSDLNFAAGYSSEDFILHTTFNNGSEFGGSIFHKVSADIDAGVEVMYSVNKKSDVLFGVAGRYQLDQDACIRGKVNNFSQLGLGYEQKLRDSIVLTFSALFDIRNFSNGKHKLGLSIQFES